MADDGTDAGAEGTLSAGAGSPVRGEPGQEWPGVILTPDQRVRVFISSTLEELAAERTAARRAVTRLHLVPVYYESGARPHPPRSMYRAYLQQSQVFVGIYWQRYGWVAPGMGISGLEDEYRLAVAAGLPMLLYLKRPAPGMEPGLAAMIDGIRRAGTASFRSFGTARELERLLAEDLAVLLSESFAGAAGEPAGPGLPGGTVTFLFTDIEGSTALLRRLGDGGYAAVLADHHRLVREALAAHGGREVDTQGDAFFAVFGTARASVAAAVAIQRAVAGHAWPAGQTLRIRVGVHAGEAEQTPAGLAGLEVHRAARIAAVAYGGQILVSAAAAALLGGALPDGARLRDLGWHRLKDLGRPEQLFQLDAPGLAAGFPPLRSLDNPRLPNNLPVQASAFIGRDAELAEISKLITTSRLITLTGPGGAGKTRLALQVAAGLLDGSGDGVWLDDLAPVADPGLVASTVASVLGLVADPGRPVAGTLTEAIGQRSLLIVLDNCEHLIDGCAKLADALLRACPNLALLATSREPLGIDGEHVYHVPPLATPADDDDPAVIRRSEAVRLLADRAAAQGQVLDDVPAPVLARIARRLDGIPLALELAAARLRSMSAEQLDTRLDQGFGLLTGGSRAAPARHQTLLAMIDWSWGLLVPAEQQVLALLSVFAGGFDLAAGEAVTAGVGVPAGDAVGHLGALVDKSLVRFDDTGAGPGRYRLLETVRQYAARRLAEQGPAAARQARIAHLDYYLALAETAAPQLTGPGQGRWLDRLDAELGNLRAALAFSQGQADPEPGLRLATALRTFWHARGHTAEASRALAALLDMPAAREPTLTRARALATAAYLLEQTGGYATAGQYCKEALATARATGDHYLEADLLQIQGFSLSRQGNTAAARPLIERGLRLARQLRDPHLTAQLLNARSYALDFGGDHEAAARDTAEALDLARQAGDTRHVAMMLNNLAYEEMGTEKLDAARGHLAEALGIVRELNDQYVVVYATMNLGLAEYLSGSPDAAARLFAESLQTARRVFLQAQIGYALLGLAMTRGSTASPDRSARLHGAADQALDTLGETLESLEASLRTADRGRLRAEMGKAAFQAAYVAGRALAQDEAIRLALSETGPAGDPAGEHA